jgi:hypothetical protein
LGAGRGLFLIRDRGQAQAAGTIDKTQYRRAS